MKAIICNNSCKKQWNEFIIKNSADFGLLQMWEWSVFQETLGKKTFKIVVEENNNILATALIIKQPLRLGKSYFYIPRGPILVDNRMVVEKQIELLELLFEKIKKLAKKEKAIFLRMDPAWKESEDLKNILLESGFKFSGQVQPKSTLILNLKKSKEDLLSEMKSKTRYNIKVAQKHGVTFDKGQKYFDDFWNLMEQTSSRQEIIPHNKNYYKKLLQVLSESNMAELVVAKYNNKVIVANFMIKNGLWCTYLHGASDYEHRNKMAPYFLQWESIKKAKEDGCSYYDFWGVDSDKWPGITRFKKGFNPEKEFTFYIGLWDEVYSHMWYNIYRLLKK